MAALVAMTPALGSAQITQIISASDDGAGTPLDSAEDIVVNNAGGAYVVGDQSDNAFHSACIALTGERSPIVNGCQNPNVLSASGAPIVGGSATSSSSSSTGHSTTTLFAYGSPLTFQLANNKGNGGVGPNLLRNILDPGGWLLGFPSIAASGGGFVATIPNDPALCGAKLSLQGLMLGGVTPFAFTEAIDPIIGK